MTLSRDFKNSLLELYHASSAQGGGRVALAFLSEISDFILNFFKNNGSEAIRTQSCQNEFLQKRTHFLKI